MTAIAVCLKTQINNQLPVLQSYLAFNPSKPTGIQYEQVAVYSLLGELFSGQTDWMNHRQGMSMIPSGTVTFVGTIFDGSPVGEMNIVDKIALAGFNDYSVRHFIKTLYGSMNKPIGWDARVDAAGLSELQGLIDEGLASEAFMDGMSMTLTKTPVTLTFSRCSQAEIDSLFQGDHNPHVDMFDSVKEMLVSNVALMDANGLSQAVYDAPTDTIIFKSDYTVGITFPEPPMMT
ncbi:hypothetical protein [Psychrobacter sp. W2-37-MNA-CIBAN-0211]|uniref:hypothetical protein n=1 Tax=Psychrobacter sp. W2-37-MNA-CIBAN-0211 TaxID=3140443 RepID=UPI003321EAAF